MPVRPLVRPLVRASGTLSSNLKNKEVLMSSIGKCDDYGAMKKKEQRGGKSNEKGAAARKER